MEQIIATYFETLTKEINSWLKSRKNIILGTAKFILVLVLTFTSAFPIKAWGILLSIITWKSFIIPFFLEYYILVFIIYPYLKNKNKVSGITEKQILFFGIPINDIAEYIVSN